MTRPQPGDFGCVPTYGDWKSRLVAEAIQWDTDSTKNHAFLYLGDGLIIEAEGGGAVVRRQHYRDDLILWSTGAFNLSDGQRGRIVNAGRDLNGTQYGWLDIVAIALASKHLGGHVDSTTWWARRVSDHRTLICSQLVDYAYHLGGLELFSDGRLDGLVSPGDLERLVLAKLAAK